MPMLLLGGYLARHYRGRYIFDYRDYTYEGFAPFRKVMHKAVEASKATFVSSDGFRFALPKVDKVYTSHNLLTECLEHRDRHWWSDGPLRISFWGYVRHEQLNRKIICALAGDARFELHFYGREQAIGLRLKAYAQELGAENVKFHGEYNPEDRYAFARQTEILHNIYSNSEAPSQEHAMTNKYYDGLALYLPQLCMKDSYMGGIAASQGVGFACDPEEADFGDRIWDWYHNLDRNEFYDRCDRALNTVLLELNNGRQVIRNAIGCAETIK
jgi:hypothetical protein